MAYCVGMGAFGWFFFTQDDRPSRYFTNQVDFWAWYIFSFLLSVFWLIPALFRIYRIIQDYYTNEDGKY